MESKSVEATGADVEAALSKGLECLGAVRDDVEVEVLDEPSRGVFGLGAREARVRLTLKPRPATAAEPERASPLPEPAAQVVPEPGAELETQEGSVARDALLELLDLMGVRNAKVEVSWTEPDPDDEEVSLLLDVQVPGDELVGPRGETLEALQHITRLLVGREQTGHARLLLDVNGHKARRRATLHQLANRLAQQVRDTERLVVLEPMPPDERRVIHLALRNQPGVRTESVGEGERRKVTIIPRRD